MWKIVLIVSIAAFVSGCSPRYETLKLYHASGATPVCIQTCEKERQTCQYQADTRQTQCMEKAAHTAKGVYKEAMALAQTHETLHAHHVQEYHQQRQSYQEKRTKLRNDYQFFSRTCKENKNAYACARARELTDDLSTLHAKAPHYPAAPKAPQFAEVLEQFTHQCAPHSRCDAGFEACYSACGGAVELVRTCISGCD